jgi:hypothetical protein
VENANVLCRITSVSRKQSGRLHLTSPEAPVQAVFKAHQHAKSRLSQIKNLPGLKGKTLQIPQKLVESAAPNCPEVEALRVSASVDSVGSGNLERCFTGVITE